MALSESGFSLAVGLTSGTIIIYHNVYGMLNTGETLDSRKPTMMHWHCEGVSGLAFTRDEIYLASSGSEGVLVREEPFFISLYMHFGGPGYVSNITLGPKVDIWQGRQVCVRAFS